jgi:uncharacterized tellurite resistance protein B-like protein
LLPDGAAGSDLDRHSGNGQMMGARTMLETLKQLLTRFGEPDDTGTLDEEELRLATAALLVRAAAIDGHVADGERSSLEAMMERHFGLDREEAEALVAEAEARERAAIDIYSFTRVVQARLSPQERRAIVTLMWEVVAADGEVHPYESNLVWRAAELVGVSTRERVLLRQDVFARLGMGGSF